MRMTESKKPIIGIDLGIDPEYLESVIRQTVSAGIAEALGGKEAVASEVIHSVLNTEVDAETGKIPQFRTSKKVSIIEYYTRQVIREQAKEIVKEVVQEQRGNLKKAVKKAINDEATLGKMAASFIDSMLNETNYYRPHFEVTFEKER